jgi:hypothetical protein
VADVDVAEVQRMATGGIDMSAWDLAIDLNLRTVPTGAAPPETRAAGPRRSGTPLLVLSEEVSSLTRAALPVADKVTAA